MTDRPGLSKGEMEVARVLWGLGEANVRQVHEAFPSDRRIDFSTVQTYLRRLEAKGYVQTRLEGRVHVYYQGLNVQRQSRERLHPRAELAQGVLDDLLRLRSQPSDLVHRDLLRQRSAPRGGRITVPPGRNPRSSVTGGLAFFRCKPNTCHLPEGPPAGRHRLRR